MSDLQLWGCIHVEEVVVWGKEMRACTYKRDNSGIGVIIFEENVIQIGLIIAYIILLLMKCDPAQHF